MAGSLRQVHQPEQFHGIGLGLLALASGNEGGYNDVLQRGKLGQQLVELEYESYVSVAERGELVAAHLACVLAVEEYLSAGGLVKGAYELQQGSLAGSAGAYDAYHLALVDGEAHSLEHLELSELLCQVLYPYHMFFITYSAM